jgi:hypothetical protein
VQYFTDSVHYTGNYTRTLHARYTNKCPFRKPPGIKFKIKLMAYYATMAISLLYLALDFLPPIPYIHLRPYLYIIRPYYVSPICICIVTTPLVRVKYILLLMYIHALYIIYHFMYSRYGHYNSRITPNIY